MTASPAAGDPPLSYLFVPHVDDPGAHVSSSLFQKKHYVCVRRIVFAIFSVCVVARLPIGVLVLDEASFRLSVGVVALYRPSLLDGARNMRAFALLALATLCIMVQAKLLT